MVCFPRENAVEALFAVVTIPLIPDILLTADSRSEVHTVREQGASLSFSCGTYSSGRRKNETVTFV